MTILDELLRLQNAIERGPSAHWHEPARGVFPPVNIYDNGECYLVRAELPGADRSTLEVTAQNDQLTLRGERFIKPAHEKAAYHRREREAGRFRRVVTLPDRVDADKIQATYKNGVLEVVIPRAAEARPRRIEIG